MSEEQEKEVVGLRIPAELVARAKVSMRGRFSSFSEYMRDLVRKDVDSREAEIESRDEATKEAAE